MIAALDLWACVPHHVVGTQATLTGMQDADQALSSSVIRTFWDMPATIQRHNNIVSSQNVTDFAGRARSDINVLLSRYDWTDGHLIKHEFDRASPSV